MANIIIMNLSQLSANAKKEYYYVDNETEPIEGTDTADAPLKYLIDLIKSENKKVDKILTVVTNEAESAFDKLKTMLETYDPDLPEPEKIPGENDIETVNSIVSKVDANDSVYIETTGGIRNTTYTLMTIVRILEYSGVKFEKAVYSNYNRDPAIQNKIEDITSTYRLFNLINAANSFTSFGSAYELENCFKCTDNYAVKDTIAAMTEFSDNISLCQISHLDQTLERINDCLLKLSETSFSKKEDALFKSLAGVIRRKFYMDENHNMIEYPAIVRWCLDNKLIQQAVTIFTEKMPQYFYKNHFFTVEKETFSEMEGKNGNSYFGLEYELFYRGMMTQSLLPDNVTMFKNIIHEHWKKNTDKNSNSIGKTLEEIIVKALSECEAVSVFKGRLPKDKRNKYDYKVLVQDLDRFFKFKRAIYDESGKRRNLDEQLNKLADYPKIQDMLINNPKGSNSLFPTHCDELTKVIDNNEKLLCYIFNVPVKYSDSHLNYIDGMTSGKINGPYNINSNISVEDMHDICMDIYYIKTFIRNKLNHASEDEYDSERTEFFSAYPRYNVESELSVEYINKLLHSSLDRIEKIKI